MRACQRVCHRRLTEELRDGRSGEASGALLVGRRAGTLTVPAGFRPAPRWYYPTTGWQRLRVDADFPLLPAPERAARRFRLLHTSDAHVLVREVDHVRAAAIARTPGGAESPGEAIWRKLHLGMLDRELPCRNEFAAALQWGAAASAPDLIVATGDWTRTWLRNPLTGR